MKVLHLINGLGRGGAEVLLREGLTVADRERFEYRYAYLRTRPDDLVPELRMQGAPVDCLHVDDRRRAVLSAKRVSRYMRQHGIQLVHAHLPIAGVVARLAGRIAKVPVVYSEHALPTCYHPLVRGLNRLTWPWQEQVIAISDDVAASIHSHVSRRVPVRTIWNGVNTTRFTRDRYCRDDVLQNLGLPCGVPVVGTVAVLRDRPEKRLDVWLDAARAIRAVEPRTRFLLVGDGPLRSKLEGRAAALGLADALIFVGRQPDVRPFLAAMDIFLLSSAYEGFGIALVEAMAMEVAVVATNVEGVRNVVASGKTGLLGSFDESVATTLAELVVSLIQQPRLRRALASAGRAAAVQRFGIARMQQELESVYSEVLARYRRPGGSG